ncbi:hypothetical protein C8R46DRAFT_1218229 [Mycena filopes]|nr:hypothetical protein C8R46DRAFT_1218229 [Mycena filopes]
MGSWHHSTLLRLMKHSLKSPLVPVPRSYTSILFTRMDPALAELGRRALLFPRKHEDCLDDEEGLLWDASARSEGRTVLGTRRATSLTSTSKARRGWEGGEALGEYVAGISRLSSLDKLSPVPASHASEGGVENWTRTPPHSKTLCPSSLPSSSLIVILPPRLLSPLPSSSSGDEDVRTALPLPLSPDGFLSRESDIEDGDKDTKTLP